MFGPASKRQEEMLKSNADITIIGGAAGSGKSYILNLIPLRYIHDPSFAGVVFRRTTKQLRGQGGMWQTAKSIYRKLPKDKRPTIRESDLTMTWPNGASLCYCHLEYDKNAEDHQGLQYSLELWDELTHFSFYQFEYLLSRLRSDAKMASRLVGSCNPDSESWVLELVSWWLDEDGFPDDSKRGKLRYFVRRNDNFIWADNPKDLEQYLEEEEERPLSLEFIAANIYDNPPCIKNNPGYLSFLKGLNNVEKSRLLYGNWYVKPEGANYFKREWLNKYDRIPNGLFVRAWDKAQSEISEVNKYPDFTACCGMIKTDNGDFVIVGNHHPRNKDKDLDIFGKFRERSGKRDLIIKMQAEYDGANCIIVLPKDPNGESEFIESAKRLMLDGFVVKKDSVKNATGKLIKFTPFSSACEIGLVGIVENTFDKKSLEVFYKELEAFHGNRSGKLYKDDWPDATATAYNYLCKETVIPQFTLPKCALNTNLIRMKKAVA